MSTFTSRGRTGEEPPRTAGMRVHDDVVWDTEPTYPLWGWVLGRLIHFFRSL